MKEDREIETFDENIARFIRVFTDVRKDVYAQMDVSDGKETWYICAHMAGGSDVTKYRVPPEMTLGDALRMFPEFDL